MRLLNWTVLLPHEPALPKAMILLCSKTTVRKKPYSLWSGASFDSILDPHLSCLGKSHLCLGLCLIMQQSILVSVRSETPLGSPLKVLCVLWADLHPPPYGMLPQALTCHGACLEKGKIRLTTSFGSAEKGLETVSHWTWTHTVQLSEQVLKEAGLEEAMTGQDYRKDTQHEWRRCCRAMGPAQRSSGSSWSVRLGFVSENQLPQSACVHWEGKVGGGEQRVSNSDKN